MYVNCPTIVLHLPSKMADDEKTVSKTYRLPVAQVEIIESFAKKQIFGTTGSAVVRALLNNAISDLVEKEYLKKYLETTRILKKQ